MSQSNTPTRLPPPLFGANEFQTDVKVVDIKAGLHHMAALTSEYIHMKILLG